MTRKEDIAYNFWENDRIWPPGLAPSSFLKALEEVLTRLPDDAFDEVSEMVSFVVEVPRITAVNVPFKRVYPSCPAGLEVQFDTIVIFHEALTYPHAAIVGLLAHEIAHSFGDKRDYTTDEQSANDLAKDWGFDKELEALLVEQKKKARAEPCNAG